LAGGPKKLSQNPGGPCFFVVLVVVLVLLLDFVF